MACQHPTTPEDPRLCYREIAPNLLNGHSVPLATSCMALSTPAFNSCRCVESGEPPRLFGVEPPRARIEAVRIIDMTQFCMDAGIVRRYAARLAQHEVTRAIAELAMCFASLSGLQSKPPVRHRGGG
jgi:hypothetical protein